MNFITDENRLCQKCLCGVTFIFQFVVSLTKSTKVFIQNKAENTPMMRYPLIILLDSENCKSFALRDTFFSYTGPPLMQHSSRKCSPPLVDANQKIPFRFFTKTIQWDELMNYRHQWVKKNNLPNNMNRVFDHMFFPFVLTFDGYGYIVAYHKYTTSIAHWRW